MYASIYMKAESEANAFGRARCPRPWGGLATLRAISLTTHPGECVR